MSLKIQASHLRSETENRYLKFNERVEVVQRNKGKVVLSLGSKKSLYSVIKTKQ